MRTLRRLALLVQRPDGAMRPIRGGHMIDKRTRSRLSTRRTAVATGLVTVFAAPAAAWAAVPGNDAFATPSPLTGQFGVVNGSNTDASKEPGEPDHAGILGNKSVWYRWTAPTTGRVVFQTAVAEGPAFDSVLAVYQGDSVAALTPVASNDDVYPDWWASRLSFDAAAGSTYQIAVDGVAGKNGPFQLAWAMKPTNDDFAAAETVVGSSGTTRSDTSLATRQPGEPRFQRRSIWYRWTAPRTGTAVFRTTGSLYDTTLSMYVGSSLGSLRLLARNDDDRSGYSTVRVHVRKGHTYRIAVDGFFGDSGPAVLHWRMT
jgi:hypothetical protein